MSQEEIRQLHNQLRTSQDKYVYFLLAVTASAIAFSVQITKDSVFSLTLLPLGVAVVCWAWSFFCGCRQIQYVNSILYSNTEYLRIKNGTHPEVGNSPNFIKAASEGLMEAISSNQDSASSHANWQFRLAIMGGVAFICWHLLKMAARTYGN
ncbi:hypothetical protein [Thalassotalea maritima]|uniref:hypothetical protein n=1 Tax=Thalassotalea maritima TaxID=3242416 RepID=UPI003528F594